MHKSTIPFEGRANSIVYHMLVYHTKGHCKPAEPLSEIRVKGNVDRSTSLRFFSVQLSGGALPRRPEVWGSESHLWESRKVYKINESVVGSASGPKGR